jgi:crossover junction endodeoxyribonuclease RuvC
MLKCKNELTILGIDPGLATTGYGLIRLSAKNPHHLKHGIISTSKKFKLAKRLTVIFQKINQLIKKNQPDLIAVEELFFYKNVKTALKVGQARGVILLAAQQNQRPVHEFTPLQVKQAITSYGRADKKQIQQMVRIILGLKNIPKPDDAADALAVAICCANSLNCES